MEPEDSARLNRIKAAIAGSNQRRQSARARVRQADSTPAVESESDRLNRISHATTQHGGRFVSTMDQSPGSEGFVAQNIMNRRGEIAREAGIDGMKSGGPVKKMAKGGVVKSSASGRSDGCAVKGKTKGRMV